MVSADGFTTAQGLDSEGQEAWEKAPLKAHKGHLLWPQSSLCALRLLSDKEVCSKDPFEPGTEGNARKAYKDSKSYTLQSYFYTSLKTLVPRRKWPLRTPSKWL